MPCKTLPTFTIKTKKETSRPKEMMNLRRTGTMSIMYVYVQIIHARLFGAFQAFKPSVRALSCANLCCIRLWRGCVIIIEKWAQIDFIHYPIKL